MDGIMIRVVFCVLSFWVGFLQATGGMQYTEIKAYVGQEAELPCRVDTLQCGKLHSVKWYRDTSRIYVFSQVGGIKRGEGGATERMEVEYEPSSTQALLKISPVQVEDDSSYKCEITYWEVREHCDVVQIIKLTTLVVPETVKVVDDKGRSISNGSKLQPAPEGTQVSLTCQAIGGKPIPRVSWYKKGEKLKAKYSSIGRAGVGTSISTLNITLSRADLSSEYTCVVESDAVIDSIQSKIYPDVLVRPTSIELNGLVEYAYEGDEAVLTCIVRGAKPAAHIMWKNNTEPILSQPKTDFVEMEDGTFTATSKLKFTVTRFENEKEFQCLAVNEVISSVGETPLKASRNLTVLYPPVVSVNPTNATIPENSSIILFCDYDANPRLLEMVVWQRDGKNLTLNTEKFESGNTEHPSLAIRTTSRNDTGSYSCIVKNSIGAATSRNFVFLNVTYPPEVQIFMSPEGPLKENECVNVTMQCKILMGNPEELEQVKWYMNGELVHEVNCSQTPDFEEEYQCAAPRKCNIDPSLILLERVDRSFAGRYSCQGKSAAGWGPLSDEKELLVYYPPRSTKIQYNPNTVIKGTRLVLECKVEDRGSPPNITYEWYKGNYLSRERNSSKWVIESVTLSDRTNFTCFAVNRGGRSEPSTVYINVLAPPAFIQKPAPYYGLLASSKSVSLACQIECYPLCSIKWLKNDHYLETKDNPLFDIVDTIHPADFLKNDFESIESTLVFNISAWPNHELEGSDLTTKYTCKTEGNGVGPNITADVEIEIEFPPEEVAVSSTNINVKEHERPRNVRCSGRGRPNLSYSWMKAGGSENISFGELLQLGPMLRSDAGQYVCNAWNKHGTASAVVNFDVLYPPECSIKVTHIDGNQALVCSVTANPEDVTFVWRKRVENYTIELRPKFQDGLSSYLVPDNNYHVLRTYICYTNNSVGDSSPCEFDVPGNVSWWSHLDADTIVLIVASIISIFICSAVICIVIVLLCRRKGSNTKYTHQMELEEREKFLCSHSPDVLGLPLVPCGRVACSGHTATRQHSTATKNATRRDGDAPNGYNERDDKSLYENLPFHEMQSRQNTFYTLTAPHCRHTRPNQQYSATLPHPKHTKIAHRAPFQERTLPKSKTFSAKKKPFQIPLQKHQSSLCFQTAESYFQPVDDQIRNGHGPNCCETERQRKRHRSKESRRNEVPLKNLLFQDDVQNCVELQYPQRNSQALAAGKGKSARGVSPNGNKEVMPEIVLDLQ